MNAIHLLSAQPWVERLGWTLLHFLWQGVLIAALYAATRKGTARWAKPDARYMLACATLAVLAAAPLITWVLLGPAASMQVPVSASFSATTSAPTGMTMSAWLLTGIPRALPEPLLPWVVALWLFGAVAFWLRLVGGWIFAVRLRSQLVRPAPGEWQRALNRLKTRIRISSPVHLLVSSRVHAPAVVGWLRPVVLVPVGALTGLPTEQVEALLLHELAHIRRHDYLVNVLQSAVEALLFYHPAVWWVSGHIRTERELCCDDVAVSVSGDALTYVRALAELESARPARLSAAMAATGGSLAHRIARLLGQSRPDSRMLSGPGILAAAMLLATTAFALFGQSANLPKFEVASIKPSQEQRFMMVRPLPGRLTANAPVRLLMQNAFTAQSFQIVGGPGWIDSERFAIEAKAAGDAGRAQIFLMLQSLLEERFQLKIHRETRELPVYTLVAAKSGLKLAPPKEGGCANLAPEALPDPNGGRMTPPGQGQPALMPCGRAGVMLAPGGARLGGGKVPMAEFIRMLSMVLGRPVIDKTGFTALFDARLEFLPDEVTEGLPAPPPGAAAASDSNYPSILSALQEQLGLRLESTKGPVEAIVIDHVERPTAN